MKDLVRTICSYLVDYPEDIQIQEVEGETTSVIELRVNKLDLGKVIGKQGNTAKSIRTILTAASTKIKKRCMLEIIE
jgi:predicted RNA-binding protein YlqC (UPF0109 family)